MGGTVLTGDGNTPEKRFDETAWEYTGGGNSTSEPAGSYQTGVASTNCTFDPDGNPYPGVRPGRSAARRRTSPRSRVTSGPATAC